jgi:hypothetical protein
MRNERKRTEGGIIKRKERWLRTGKESRGSERKQFVDKRGCEWLNKKREKGIFWENIKSKVRDKRKRGG